MNSAIATPRRRHLLRRLCELVLLLTSFVSLYTCPHSKVEESFNLQASHDLFYYGLGPAWTSSSWRRHDGDNDDGITRASCDGAAGARGQAETCSSRIGNDILPYDHVQFPGVVPRTFMGAFILSSIAKIISFVIPKRIFDLPSHPMIVQFLIRLELLLVSWMAHLRLSSSIEAYFQRRTQQVRSISTLSTLQLLQSPPMISSYYLLITASQFHLPFYSSRLLPNTFALILATHAYADWFNDRHRRTAAFLVVCTVVFRCDILPLLFTVGLMMLIRRQLTIVEAICTGVVSGLLGLLLTVPLDSLLWGRPIWPEFEVLWFNTVDNKSSEWGTMPYHWYLTSGLPRGMLLTALLVPLAFVRLPEMIVVWLRSRLEKSKTQSRLDGLRFSTMFDLCLLPLFASVLGYVLLYSFLPHKEIRFIFPAMPIFNVCAAYGMSRLHRVAFPHFDKENKAKGSAIARNSMLLAIRGMYLCGVMLMACTMLGSLVFVRISKENYPGGVALSRLRQYLDASIPPPSALPMAQSLPTSSLSISRTLLENKQQQSTKWQSVSVHIDVAAAMTGVSLFGQKYASYRDGKGKIIEGPFRIEKAGYEDENNLIDLTMVFTHLLTERHHVKGYHVVDTILGHPRLDLHNVRIDTKEAIYIMERDSW